MLTEARPEATAIRTREMARARWPVPVAEAASTFLAERASAADPLAIAETTTVSTRRELPLIAAALPEEPFRTMDQEYFIFMVNWMLSPTDSGRPEKSAFMKTLPAALASKRPTFVMVLSAVAMVMVPTT